MTQSASTTPTGSIAALLTPLIEQYGNDAVRARVGDLDGALHMLSEPDEDPAALDEFATSGLRSPADIRDAFARQCFFGCEADDPTWALAFAPEYHGTRLGAMFASDLGHWDVPDATAVLPEAWELVERGLVATDDFRAFTHDHALALWGPTPLRRHGGGNHMTHPLADRNGRFRRRDASTTR